MIPLHSNSFHISFTWSSKLISIYHSFRDHFSRNQSKKAEHKQNKICRNKEKPEPLNPSNPLAESK